MPSPWSKCESRSPRAPRRRAYLRASGFSRERRCRTPDRTHGSRATPARATAAPGQTRLLCAERRTRRDHKRLQCRARGALDACFRGFSAYVAKQNTTRAKSRTASIAAHSAARASLRRCSPLAASQRERERCRAARGAGAYHPVGQARPYPVRHRRADRRLEAGRCARFGILETVLPRRRSGERGRAAIEIDRKTYEVALCGPGRNSRGSAQGDGCDARKRG